MGRKVVLIGSAIGMGVAMCILGASFTLMEQPGYWFSDKLTYSLTIWGEKA